jgi:hypothetical protein
VNPERAHVRMVVAAAAEVLGIAGSLGGAVDDSQN